MSAQADELDFASPDLMYSPAPSFQVNVVPRNYVLELANATEALNRPACNLKYERNHLQYSPGFAGSFNDHAVSYNTRRCWEWDESGLTWESAISTSTKNYKPPPAAHAAAIRHQYPALNRPGIFSSTGVCTNSTYAVTGPTLLDIESALAATQSHHEEITSKGSKAVLGMSSLKRTATEQRYTLRVRSQEHTVEDGYRWRKYGQKLIKASSHPRSYYRCTDARCHVKKRVERSSVEAGVMEVTYEGIHLHHRPFSLAPLALSKQQQKQNE